ncbi:cytochrome b/b6 domain-containing protein (plasmid) [Photobacterium sp. DA100]|uniref:cytochrome b n=1 Tax=Photobacterium sp. DA100 TaxID=3027472 RepID=UPI0024785C13|nr:cytochrome b/b6 domain-containing protein [Photobacterium sp. DA100]WEM44652.1 cytochrome b/b6 domain-containing protein [Photobacterium sp. DA100]
MEIINYDKVTRYLHWIMAVIIIYATAAGYVMHLVIDSHPPVFNFLSVMNMSLATVGSGVFVVRWAWKYFRPTRAFSNDKLPHWQLSAAHMIHGIIYQLMFVVFISGFLMLETSYPLFWLVEIPNLINSREINSFFFMVHRYACASLAVVIALHACAALKHHFVAKNQVLLRMMGRAKQRI